MPTTVGTENTLEDLVKNLLALEHDALAAYEAVIERLGDAGLREKVESFRQDHEAHVRELEGIASGKGIEAPQEGDVKQWLTTGKVAMADLMGDKTMLGAMKTNEDDTVQAYSQALENPASDDTLRPILEKALADERRHRTWMEQVSS
ncbi:DUF892 family protein [Aquicoccus sp. SCR17]|nr:DUF892 family protein [Carideicomes alvinocaridis]